MLSGRVGLKRYIIPITFDIFKPMWSMCLLHFRSEDIISPRQLNSDTLSESESESESEPKYFYFGNIQCK